MNAVVLKCRDGHRDGWRERLRDGEMDLELNQWGYNPDGEMNK